MGKGKSSKQEVESKSKQEVDKSLVKDYQQILEAGRALSALRTQPNRNVTIAGFTPAQLASFGATNQAAGAFGMQGADFSMPATQMSANGIAGYSAAPEFDKAVSMLPDDYTRAVEQYYRALGGEPTAPQAPTGGTSSATGRYRGRGGRDTLEEILGGSPTKTIADDPQGIRTLSGKK